MLSQSSLKQHTGFAAAGWELVTDGCLGVRCLRLSTGLCSWYSAHGIQLCLDTLQFYISSLPRSFTFALKTDDFRVCRFTRAFTVENKHE